MARNTCVPLDSDNDAVLGFRYLLDRLEDATEHDQETVLPWAEYIAISGTGATHEMGCPQFVIPYQLIIPDSVEDDRNDPNVVLLPNAEMREIEENILTEMFGTLEAYQAWRSDIRQYFGIDQTFDTKGICTCYAFLGEQMEEEEGPQDDEDDEDDEDLRPIPRDQMVSSLCDCLHKLSFRFY